MVPRKTVWYRKIWQQFLQELRWLTPGLGVKRWLGLILIGTTLIGLGFAVVLIDIYRTAPSTWVSVLSALSLRELDRTLRGVIFGALGTGLIAWGIWGLNRALLKPFIPPGKQVLDAVSAYRKRERGPRIVAIGGGTGLSSLLRGLKTHTSNLTAIVTVADDGGSSGELRRSMGILPPGDIRNCLAALSNDEALMTQIFQYRFGSGAGLNGHSLGNLFITALADITGSFEEGVAESGRVLAVQGRVLPSTLHDVRLVADVQLPHEINEVRVKGESQIPKTAGQVRRVWLEPNNPLAYPPSVQAILSADLVILGPGSLYTSLLPNLLVPDLAEALRRTRAQKFYVCNVATQKGETDDYSCGEHVRTIEKHLGGRLFDLIVCNRRYEGKLEDESWVKVEPGLEEEYPLYQTDLIDEENPRRHDSYKLAQVIMDLFFERTGPLSVREDEITNANN
jgi:uncharacterized cofD-like protein